MTEPTDQSTLDATARVLARTGIGGLTLSAIAEEAGISRVTLHRRGASVAGLVVEVSRRASDDLRRALWPTLTGGGDAADRLDRALRTLCEVAERHAGPLVALYGQPAVPLPDAPERTTSFQFIEPFERLLADGVLDGSLRSEDPKRDATLAANAVFWSYLHMRRAHRWDPPALVDRLVAMAVAPLLAVPSADRAPDPT